MPGKGLATGCLTAAGGGLGFEWTVDWRHARLRRFNIEDVPVLVKGLATGCLTVAGARLGFEWTINTRVTRLRRLNMRRSAGVMFERHRRDSVALLQGALSLWSDTPDIPHAPGQAGYFHRIFSDARVAGPFVTTQSEHDTAVGTMYPLAAGVARQVHFAPGELPKYGPLGTFGLRGPGPDTVDMEMLPADGSYDFVAGKVYNLESSQYICEMQSASSGAHSDLAHPEVAHAVWEAVRCGL